MSVIDGVLWATVWQLFCLAIIRSFDWIHFPEYRKEMMREFIGSARVDVRAYFQFLEDRFSAKYAGYGTLLGLILLILAATAILIRFLFLFGVDWWVTAMFVVLAITIFAMREISRVPS
ncbi:hypothetical protein C4577_02635 [Candidatus Parcubacteria bacterium]|nr:MAG: hypothetical protein C4577_02635 [Candidatus Parcubacteria bacterium]